MTNPLHPRQALFDPGEPVAPRLPVCDHYAGTEDLMRKSLALQSRMGPVFDVTLDNEDGAAVGNELVHARLIAELLGSEDNRFGRVGVRVLPLMHPRSSEVLRTVVRASRLPAYLMLPKPASFAEVERAVHAVDAAGGHQVPLHVLIETHGALRDVMAIAAHPRIESLSLGLMDFVSAHHGAIPLSAMGLPGQFEHPLVVRAKIEISAACHANGKLPSHCVVTEFKNTKALQTAANRACREFGYMRMWSIHPSQVETIIEAFSPTTAEVDLAVEILLAAQAADWAPTRHRDQLHDRASYRYFWHLLERAQSTSTPDGQQLPAAVRAAFFPDLDT